MYVHSYDFMPVFLQIYENLRMLINFFKYVKFYSDKYYRYLHISFVETTYYIKFSDPIDGNQLDLLASGFWENFALEGKTYWKKSAQAANALEKRTGRPKLTGFWVFRQSFVDALLHTKGEEFWKCRIKMIFHDYLWSLHVYTKKPFWWSII